MRQQNFTIDYLTGNTPVAEYTQYDATEHHEQTTKTSDLSFQSSVNLDDVFSVISKDAAEMTSSLDIPRSSQSPIDLSRGTPSPNRDSGIDSDMSPGFPMSNESIAETLSKLDQTADAVKTKSSVTSTDKPGTSYLALIAKAILSSPRRKLTLGDIYRQIMDTYPYYNNTDKTWRGSVRYTLSINECFVKDGKDESGKGNYWAIHPNCINDFEKGDYRRRQARRRARKNVKSVSSVDLGPPALMTSRANAAYTPMTSPYVYNQPYFPGQPGYGYTPQGYTPDLQKDIQSQGAATTYPSTANTVQPHPAFGYSNYPAAYGYMYPDYYAMESAYRRQYDAKKVQQYQAHSDMKKEYTTDSALAQNGQELSHKPDSYSNIIHIL